jgi:outer membrane protein OmpA-like peptidoglycan-associated protein
MNSMRLPKLLLLSTSLSLLAFPVMANAAFAQEEMPAQCKDAGVKSMEECQALIKGGKPEEKKPEEKPKQEKPAEQPAPAAEKPAAEQPAPAAEPPAKKPAAEELPVQKPRKPLNEKPPVEQQAPAAAPVQEQAPAVEPPAEPKKPNRRKPVDEVPVENPAPAAVEQLAPAVEPPAQPKKPNRRKPIDEVPVDKPAPAAAEQPAPAVEPPAAPAAEQAAPVEQPAAPARKPRVQKPVEPAPEPQAAPAVEQPAPAAAAKPAVPAAENPVAPLATEKPAAPVKADITANLQNEVKRYNRAVQAFATNPTKARGQISDAKAKIDALCASAPYASTEECLAAFGVQLPPVPEGAAAAPAEQPAAPEAKTPVAPAAPVAADKPQAPPPQKEIKQVEAPKDQPAQPVEVVKNLPKGVTQQDVAPLLDSAKDQIEAPVAGQPGQPGKVNRALRASPAQQAQQPVDQTPPPPPPTSDANAQAKVQQLTVVPVEQEQGQKIAAPPAIQVPQNVTIINQTNVTTTNNTTSVTNNNAPADGRQRQGRPGPGRPGDNNGGRPGQDQQQPDLGTQILLQIGQQLFINNPQQDRDRIIDRQNDNVFYEDLGRGRVRETIARRDGSKIVTVRNRNGDILRRSRIAPDGREYVLAYFDDRNQAELDNWRDPGEDLPPLRLNIPAQDYVLDADTADETQVDDFFRQPPVEQVRRIYSIDEVKRSSRIRDTVRRLEIGDLTFDTGAATISQDQVGALANVAKAMLKMLDANPAETFLIEGHTDAVGADIDNLKLSDLRAATVARILTDFYDVPPENLETQGYGERYLKVITDQAERANRRVTIRRITPLVAPVANQ